MPSEIASLVFAAGIIGLFILDRRKQPRPSWAMWIPIAYVFVLASRPLSLWLGADGINSAVQAEEGSPVDAAFYSSIYVLALAVLVKRGAQLRTVVRKMWPVLPFFGYCLISLAWSDFPVIALKRWFKLLGELMVVLVVLTDPRPAAAIRRLLAAPAFLLVPLSVLFIKYYPDLGRGYDGWTGVQYYHGASYNKNGLGVMCLYCGLAYVWLLCREIDRKPRDRHALVIAGCVLAMCVWLLAKANSATASSCFGMGTVLILLTRLRVAVRRPALIHGTVIAITAVPFTVLFLGQITSTLDLLQRDSTLTDRTLLWEAILRLQTNPVLGSGYESFWLGWRLDALWDVFWWRPNQAHNGFIEIYINLGWVGIGLLALLVFASYRRCLGAVRLGMPSGSLLLTYTVIAIPYNFTEAAFKIHTLPWMFLVLAVTGSCAAAAAHSPVSRPRVEFPTRVPSGRGITAPVCAATARSAFRRPIGSR